jgi:hypothetical protein
VEVPLGAPIPCSLYIADPDLYHVAPSQFAIDGKIEQCSVPEPLLSIKPETNGPDLLRLERALRADNSAGHSRRGARGLPDQAQKIPW